ncbi:response regulator [Ruegeria sp. SCP11]|uniref:response regulator n=1 Tax=Ruegeria sp. SCP11 TaxID=3141378 RepID=UPI0033362D6B
MADLKWIEDFIDLCDTGNFSTTADNRFVTQPALSRRIKQLEYWVGAQLFERSSRPISLTKEGAAFRPVAEDILRWMNVARSGGNLGVGITESLHEEVAVSSLPLSAVGLPHSDGLLKNLSRISQSDVHAKRGKILIVDDSAISLKVLANQIRNEGYSPVTVESAKAALDALTGGDFQLVLTDVEMPGIDGSEFTEMLRARESDCGGRERVPIVAVTGYTDLETIERCFQSGMDDYLSKPVGAVELRVVLDRWVSASVTIEAAEREALETRTSNPSDAIDMGVVSEFCASVRHDIIQISKSVELGDFDFVSRAATSLRAEAYMLGAYSFGRSSTHLANAALQQQFERLIEKRGPFLSEFIRLQRAAAS